MLEFSLQMYLSLILFLSLCLSLSLSLSLCLSLSLGLLRKPAFVEGASVFGERSEEVGGLGGVARKRTT